MTSPGPQPNAIQKHAAPLRQQVVEALRSSIVSGQLAPGQRLTERELIEMFGVSRTVIREVLRLLEAERLIEIIPHKGPVVRELSAGEAKDLYAIRAVLEGLAARLFAENALEARIDALDAALDEVKQAYKGSDGEAALRAKTRFYETLYGGASSETLASLLATVEGRIWRWRAVGLTHPNRAQESLNESIANLDRLLAAIHERDGDAAEKISRKEVDRAAAEVMRLIATEE